MGGFELWRQREDGCRGETIARGSISVIVSHIRALGLLAMKDNYHPLGVYYVSAKNEIFVIDFVMDP